MEYVTSVTNSQAGGAHFWHRNNKYEGVSRSFRTGHLERELEIIQLSATRRSFTVILWVSLVSFDATTLFFSSEQAFIVLSIYFFIDSVRKLLDSPSYLERGSEQQQDW